MLKRIKKQTNKLTNKPKQTDKLKQTSELTNKPKQIDKLKQTNKPKRMRLVKLILKILFLTLIAWIIIENASQTVTMSLLGNKISNIPFIILMFVAILIGVIITIPLYFSQWKTQKKEIKIQKKEIKKQGKNIDKQNKEITKLKEDIKTNK